MRLSERLPLQDRMLVAGTLPLLLLPGRLIDGAVTALILLAGVVSAMIARRLLRRLPLPARLGIFLPLCLGGGMQLLQILGQEFQLANPFLALCVFNAMALMVIEEPAEELPDAVVLTNVCFASALIVLAGAHRGLQGLSLNNRMLPAWEGLLQPAILPLLLAMALVLARRGRNRGSGS